MGVQEVLGGNTDQSRVDAFTEPSARTRFLPVVLIATATLCATFGFASHAVGAWMTQIVAWVSIGFLVSGIRRHGLTGGPWSLVATGFGMFAVGDLLFMIHEDLLHISPFPSVADVAYLAGYPFAAAGLASMVRVARPEGDTGRHRHGSARAALIDAGIVVTPVAVGAWIYLIDPVATAEGQSLVERLVSAAYPMFDLICLGVLIRMAISFSRTSAGRQPSLGLLVSGFVAMLFADVWFLIANLHDSTDFGSWRDATYLVPYVFAAAAANHVSAERVCDMAPAPDVTLSRRRLALLASAALVTPSILAAQWLTDKPLAIPLVVAGTMVSFLLVVTRMSGLMQELESSRSAMRFDATHDMLTGLPNRAHFAQCLQNSLISGTEGALLFIDLDRFKQINDTLGHQTGDEVLREAACRLRRCVRETDIVARLAGDEFVVLMERIGETELIDVIARLEAEMAISRENGDRQLTVTASIGVARWNPNTPQTDASALMHAADYAMYQSKAAKAS